MSKRKTKEEFIKEAKKVHGEFYCYKNVVYIMNKSTESFITNDTQKLLKEHIN
jgi:hypothetical protein